MIFQDSARIPSIHFEGTVFIHLTTKDQLTEKWTDYLLKLISINKIIAESRS